MGIFLVVFDLIMYYLYRITGGKRGKNKNKTDHFNKVDKIKHDSKREILRF